MRIKKCSMVMLFSIACVFVVANSMGIIRGYNNDDCMIFNTIGKFWEEGKVPYIDLFDHKGPLIFFINMLSWKFFHCEQGTLFFQIFSIFVMLIFLFKIAKLEVKSNWKCLFFTVITLLFLGLIYSGGNMTEEYCLPFITASLYFTLVYLKKYVDDKVTKHSIKYAFVYGISFAVCFLTRVTNAVGICVGILLILIILIKEKEGKNIFENALGFLIGFLAIFVPFAVYFAKKNAFYEMLEGTILFNLKYATNSASWLQGEVSMYTVRLYLQHFFPSYMIFIVGLLKFKKEKNAIGIFYILLGIFETILFMTGRLLQHYAMICLPNLLLIVLELEKSKISKNYKVVVYSFMIIGCLGISIKRYIKRIVPDHSAYESLMVQIPETEKESFIAVDVSFRAIYERYDVCPYYKYFVLQDFQASNSEKLYQQMYDTFLNGHVKWILFGGNLEESFMKTIVKERYDVVAQEESIGITLYRMKD